MDNEVNEPTPSQAPVTAITVNVQDLVALVSATVAQVLQQQQGQFAQGNIGQVIGEAVAEGMRKNTRPKVTVGEYLRKTHTSMHPDPEFPNGPKLTRLCFNCGVPIFPHNATDQEINLLNQITHSGMYINRRVQVVLGIEGNDEVLYVMFNNKPDAMQDLKNYVHNFEDMLEQIVAQQVIEDEEKEVEKQMKMEVSARRQKNRELGAPVDAPVKVPVERGYTGNSKAYREARAAAEAREAAKANHG